MLIFQMWDECLETFVAKVIVGEVQNVFDVMLHLLIDFF